MADTTNDTNKPAKKIKKKGPIRWEAIVPFFIFVFLVWAYFFFFFDNHLKRALEYVGTNVNGAEVNIADIRTSFWKASLEIDGIQITDGSEPIKNKIQLGAMRWKMMWDALLRGKIAIEDASILEVAIGVPRKKPGRVLPPPPPGSQSAFDKVRQAAISKAQEELSHNILGDVAAILGGVDPKEQLKNIEGTLKSSLRVKELQTELAAKEKEWRERIDRLPQAKDFKALEQRFKAVKKDNFQSPQELQASLNEFNAIYNEVNARVQDVQNTGTALRTDTANYTTAIRDLEAMVRQDINDLEQRLKIPKLDAGSISRSVFGPLFLDKVKQAEFYMAKAREYMPPKKTAEQKAEYAPPKPRERENGRNYKFGRPNSYPLFWLKHAAISSKATKGADWSGDLSGTLRDVTDDPPILGRPTIATFKGDFPKQEFFGVLGEITIDHTTDNPLERAQIKVAQLPVLGRILVDSPDVKLGFDNARAALDLNGELRGGEIKLTMNSIFSKKPGTQNVLAGTDATPPTKGDTAQVADSSTNLGPSKAASTGTAFLTAEAKQPILSNILQGALADIPRVTLNAGVAGPWSALRFNINSSLGEDLVSAFDKQVKLKIAEARAQLEVRVNEEVGKQKERLTAEFNKVKSQVDTTIKAKEDEINKFKAQIETAKNEAINSQKKRLEGEAKKGLDQLRKGLGF